jgi:hypothetical protein
MLARAWNAAPRTGGVLVSKKITLEWDISAIKVEQYRWGCGSGRTAAHSSETAPPLVSTLATPIRRLAQLSDG